MLDMSVFFIILELGSIYCTGSGPPGSAPRFQASGGIPGSIGGPNAQLVFPPNPEFGQIVKIDDPEEANARHIFSDPRGPIGIINDRGEYQSLQNPSSELRSKNRPQVRHDQVDENDWQRVGSLTESESDGSDSGIMLPQPDNKRNRAGTLYNMFHRNTQAGPEGPPRRS